MHAIARQLPLEGLGQERLTGIVNVASVPQRSPFRYPGGKTWLVPLVRRWIRSRSARPHLFLEPFVGGGIISLTVAFEGLADRVLMVELDKDVAAVWQAMLSDDREWLANAVAAFKMDAEHVRAALDTTPADAKHRAFLTLLKNRVYHGGILAPGSGLIKHGENGKGLSSRWYPETLQRRILAIGQVCDRIDFIHGDGLETLRQAAPQRDAMSFIDPPYTAPGKGKRAGTRLYTHFELDHEALFDTVATLTGDFLMTYDIAPEVEDLARRHGFDMHYIAMKNTHHAQMRELLIGRNLDWAR